MIMVMVSGHYAFLLLYMLLEKVSALRQGFQVPSKLDATMHHTRLRLQPSLDEHDTYLILSSKYF